MMHIFIMNNEWFFLNKKLLFCLLLVLFSLLFVGVEARYTLYERYSPYYYELPQGYYFVPYYQSDYFQLSYYNNGKYYSLGYGEINWDKYYGEFLTVRPNVNWYANFSYPAYYGYGGYYYSGCGPYYACYKRIFYPACIGYFCYS